MPYNWRRQATSTLKSNENNINKKNKNTTNKKISHLPSSVPLRIYKRNNNLDRFISPLRSSLLGCSQSKILPIIKSQTKLDPISIFPKSTLFPKTLFNKKLFGIQRNIRKGMKNSFLNAWNSIQRNYYRYIGAITIKKKNIIGFSFCFPFVANKIIWTNSENIFNKSKNKPFKVGWNILKCILHV